MNEVHRIAEQVASGYRNGAWPGVSVRDLLRQLSAVEAAAHPIVGGHSAWEIALHLGYWHNAVRCRLAGEAVEYGPEDDWPQPAPATTPNWHAALAVVDRAHEALVQAISALTPQELDAMVPGRTFNVYFMLHGVPQHDLYHGGQVMMLTKAMRARRDGAP